MLNKDQMLAPMMKDVASQLQFGLKPVHTMGILPFSLLQQRLVYLQTSLFPSEPVGLESVQEPKH